MSCGKLPSPIRFAERTDTDYVCCRKQTLTAYEKIHIYPCNGSHSRLSVSVVLCSGIGEELFRLVISGSSGEYEGHFTIN